MEMSLFTFENLYEAYVDCRKNKRNKPDALRFEIHWAEEIRRLQIELAERTYHPLTSDRFAAERPKLREIFAADFRDRVVHHLAVGFLEPVWEKIFIYDSYASRDDKGIHLAAKRLAGFTRKATCNNYRTAYYMQLDIRNFFMSIDKRILFDLIRSRRPPEEILWLAGTIIFHDPTKDYRLKSSPKLLSRIPPGKTLFGCKPDTGLPIGNLTSQFFANVYLNDLDQLVKHKLKCRYYMRYVDDFVLLHQSREKLLEWKEEIVDFLRKERRLELNPTRTKIRPISNGIDFLGYVVRPEYTLSRKRVVNNFKAKLKELKKRLIRESGGVRIASFDQDDIEYLHAVVNSYLAHFKHANTYRLVNSLLLKNGWLFRYFHFQGEKLVRNDKPPKRFRNFRRQYRFFQRRNSGSLMFFQVGCFYEFYGWQAIRAMEVLGLQRIEEKHGFKVRCGIGINTLERFLTIALKQRIPATVVRQTGYYLPRLVERKVYATYTPVSWTIGDIDLGLEKTP